MTIIYSLLIVALFWYVVHLISQNNTHKLNGFPKAEKHKRYSKEIEKKLQLDYFEEHIS